MKAVLIGCLLLFGGRGVAGEPWPTVSDPPIADAALSGSFTADAEARNDSLWAALGVFFSSGSLRPPAEPSPVLISWIIELATHSEKRALDRFAATNDPTSWAAADPHGRLSLPLALALQEAGRPREALGWLERGATNEADAVYRTLVAIELLQELGESERAQQRARQLVASEPRDPRVLPAARLIIETLEESEQHEELLAFSIDVRRQLGPGADETAARFRALCALERFGEAVAVGDTLLREYPGTRTARREAIRRFEERSQPLDDPQVSLLIPVLLEHACFGEIEEIVSQRPGAFDLRLDFLERLLSARLYERILRDREPLPPTATDGDRSRWYLVHARAARNTLRFETMERFYRGAAALGGATRVTALWEWGREAESEQKEPKADSIYTLLMQIPSEQTEARYRRGLSRYAASRYQEARVDFEPLDRAVGNGGAGFWKFRLAELLGDTTQARVALARAAEGEGYYGSRARAEMAMRQDRDGKGDFWAEERERMTRATSCPNQAGSPECQRKPEASGRAERVRLFRRYGRSSWASLEGVALAASLTSRTRVEELLCLGLPDLAVRAAIAEAGAPRSLLYPRPFAVLLAREAARVGVAIELVWAIARRESLFDPGAVSGAGAIGLLQMMPTTARETARQWGLEAGPLERADRNAALALSHWRDLVDRYDWPLPALLAAYNAGAGKTSEWVERFPDPDLFIERVGWKETRSYVRHVLDGCWKYRDACRASEDSLGDRPQGPRARKEGSDR